jgi:alanine racemase
VPLRALARVDTGAIERNCARLAALAPLCAVVKADGYGHGAARVAEAALRGGATWLAVATANEAADLRAAGTGGPVLVLGALTPEELDIALRAGADVVAWREEFVGAIAARVEAGAWRPAPPRATGAQGAGSLGATRAALPQAAGADVARVGTVGVHVKLDTGMGRLGTRDPLEATAVAERVRATPGVHLAGAMTHFATADDDPDFMREQLRRFTPWADGLGTMRHAANSAAALAEPAARLDLIRCGIAVYGLDPFHRDPADHGLEPALELVSYVAEVKRARRGESVGYGRRFVAERDTWIATIPIGYGDGFRRGLTNRFEVLVDGRRVPGVGTVSMDNVTADLGDRPVERGAEVVLVGARGDERILAEDLARALGTINYEITCGITARVPRTGV